MKAEITANGVVGGTFYNTSSERIRIKLGGDLGGGTVAFFEWLSLENTPDLNGSDWVQFATLNTASVGADGLDYNIGTDRYWYATVTGAGSPSAILEVSSIDLGA